MSRERWGTFSVNDHLRPRAFVADVLLYDKLIIPVPPTTEERNRWETNNWDPDKQSNALDILGDLATPVPWDEVKENAFRTRQRLACEADRDTRAMISFGAQGQDPYAITRGLLGQEFRPPLPKGVRSVWTVAAYSSLKDYQDDAKLETEADRRDRLAMVLKQRFFVPEEAGKTDEEMLKTAVDLANRDDFKEKRAKLHRWQEDIIENGIPDAKAIEEMEDYLKQFDEVVKKARTDVYWKFAFMAVPLAISIATAGLGAPLVIAGAGGLISVAAFAKFDRKPKIDDGECEAAAVIHDAREAFNWNSHS
jgi:hypothetical protein